MKKYILISILAALSLSSHAQNVRWDLPIYTTQAQGGNLLPVYAVPGASVSFYSCAGSSCSTLATTYNSATSAVACPTNAQVVLNGSATCVNSADPYGNMGSWFQPGQYMAKITYRGSSYNYYFTVGQGNDPYIQSFSCTGQKNDTDRSTIQTAANFLAQNSPSGRATLHFPEGQSCYIYIPSGSSVTEALLFTSPISIDGSARVFFDVPNNTDWIRYAPTASPSYYPSAAYLMQNVSIKDVILTGAINVGTPNATGRNGIVFDCSANAIGAVSVDNVTINPLNNGYSLYSNNTTPEPNGCIFLNTITNSHFWNGLFFYKAGDTIKIEGNQINNQTGDGINIYSIGGAIDNVISKNNIVSNGSTIHLRAGNHFIIRENEVGLSSFGTVPTTPTIWLDGAAGAAALNDITISHNFLGVDQPIRPEALPLLQIDSGVTNVNIEPNAWQPEIVSGTPTAGILNNGSYTCLRDGQIVPNFPNYVLLSGSGSLCKDDTVSLSGLGSLWQNRLPYSNDLTQSPWTTSSGGVASAPTVTTVTTTLPNGTTGSASRLQMTINAGTTPSDFAAIQQTLSGLANPHSSVSQVYLKSNTCTLYTVQLAQSLGGEGVPVDCTGDENGWRHPKVGIPANNASTGDIFKIQILGGSVYSSTVDILVYGAQQSDNVSSYIATSDQAVAKQYGTNGNSFVGPTVASPWGWQDTTTAARPTCRAAIRGMSWDEKGTGPNGSDVIYRCNLVTASPATYAWQKDFQLTQQPENYLLQSNTWNVSPWVLEQTGVASSPTVASNGATDPFGNTGTVQRVQFALNGGSTSAAESIALQVISGRPNPHTGLLSIWVKLNSGGTTRIHLQNGASGGVAPVLTQITVTSSWQQVQLPVTVNGTSDAWEALTIGGSDTDTADVLVYGAQMSYSGGSYVTTTTAPIDLTNFTSLGTGFFLGTPLTVSTLPGCTATTKNAYAAVSDATTPTYLGTLTGGSTVFAPVVCNGTAWVSY